MTSTQKRMLHLAETYKQLKDRLRYYPQQHPGREYIQEKMDEVLDRYEKEMPQAGTFNPLNLLW